MNWSVLKSKSNVKELMWSQVLDLNKFGGCGGNMESKSRSKQAFEFLKYLMVLSFFWMILMDLF